MQNQMCRVCEEPAAGFHFGAFTCEGCKSFFGRTCNNQSVIQECKNNYRCVVDKKNRTACKACRLRKCLMVGMSKSGSRYGRRSNWFKIHCLMQQSLNGGKGPAKPSNSNEVSPLSSSSLSPSSPPRTPSKIELESRKSPEMHSPTMVPRTPNFAPIQIPPVQPPQRPASPPKSEPNILQNPPLYGFPPTFPLMSTPGFHSLPFHKQALLSPLLAHTHLWQMARNNPLFQARQQTPELDLMAEHKALMERFALMAQAAQIQAAASKKEAENELSVSPPPPSSSPKIEIPQNLPMDLSAKRSSDEESETEMESGPKLKKVKSDLNRNVVVKSSGSEADDDEELDVEGENLR